MQRILLLTLGEGGEFDHEINLKNRIPFLRGEFPIRKRERESWTINKQWVYDGYIDVSRSLTITFFQQPYPFPIQE